MGLLKKLRACTAREAASAEHLPSREVVKTVVVFGDEGDHTIVAPARVARVVIRRERRGRRGLDMPTFG